MVGNGVLDHLQQLLLRIDGPDAQLVQQLHHQPRETLERTGDSDAGIDLYQHAPGSVYVDLQLSGLVDGRVQQRQETLVGYVGPGLGDVTAHLPQQALVVVTVQQRKLVAAGAASVHLVGLQACLRQHHHQTLGGFVAGTDRGGLHGHEGRGRGRVLGLGILLGVGHGG